MPHKPKKPCSYPGCPNLTYGYYCEEHEQEARKHPVPYTRNKERDKDYNHNRRDRGSNKAYGRTWRKVRDAYRQKHPLCEKCLEQGKLVPVYEVHHIVPVKQGGKNTEDNLMSLCHRCHTRLEPIRKRRGF